MAANNMASPNTRRYVDAKGHVRNEGAVQVGVPRPYRVDYGSIVPKAAECENLIVPVCLSASHIAYGSIRMEPVFMILGQSASTAASLAVDQNLPVQQVPYTSLSQRLVADKQVLAWDPKASSPAAVTGTLSPARVVCFGDSITRGGYPDVLAKTLGVEVANAGVNGNSSAMGLARMENDVLARKPEVVVVMFGTNDTRID